ncbi:MAG: DUF2239 family protein [Alphaproteobacteria bacterium]|jgi:uncharacterized protein|nr:DUF2239 family protein [Alphaproteobacteria bacterium]
MTTKPRQFVAFAGHNLIARGTLEGVVLLCKQRLDEGEDQRIALYDDGNGGAVDVDFHGTVETVIENLADHPLASPPSPAAEPGRGPGRPKLGVVSREISLLPRHWEWLAEQRSGASATLRRLVDDARKSTSGQQVVRQQIDGAHKFMWDLAGDSPGFEEAARALFNQDFDAFATHISEWPKGVREQLKRFTDRARAAAAANA